MRNDGGQRSRMGKTGEGEVRIAREEGKRAWEVEEDGKEEEKKQEEKEA